MAVFDQIMDFSCFETQIGDGSEADCEILELSDSEIMTVKQAV